uniref:Uncharacterized protein n=1 Tax=Nelumbo nucifera TaxID=4432 RepID=A0A822XRH7_NELNU|nr:TPA_asm: hypothetical protein HUJ06_022838 [Nelumbo nucifera]
MKQIVTIPFFTNKVVQQYQYGWKNEAAWVED